MKCRYAEKRRKDNVKALQGAYGDLFVQALTVNTFKVLTRYFGFGKIRINRLAEQLVDEFIDTLNGMVCDEMNVKSDHHGIVRGNENDIKSDAVETAYYYTTRELGYHGFDIDIYQDFDLDDDWISVWRKIEDVDEARFKMAWYFQWERRVTSVWVACVLLLLNRLFGFGKDRLTRFYGYFLTEMRSFIELFVCYPSKRGKAFEFIENGVKELEDKKMSILTGIQDEKHTITINDNTYIEGVN